MNSRANWTRPPLLAGTENLARPGQERLTSFDEALEEQLIGERVIVQSGGGERFEGELDRIQHQNRHVLLTDVEEHPGGATFPRVFAPCVDLIVQLPPDGPASYKE